MMKKVPPLKPFLFLCFCPQSGPFLEIFFKNYPFKKDLSRNDKTEDPSTNEKKSKYTIARFCSRQLEKGRRCREDRECQTNMICSLKYTSINPIDIGKTSGFSSIGTCQPLFSLTLGQPASHDYLCQSGWRNSEAKCAYTSKSKNLGRACNGSGSNGGINIVKGSKKGNKHKISSGVCPTTDPTGREAECLCKPHWSEDDSEDSMTMSNANNSPDAPRSSICEPVFGDYRNHGERVKDWIFFKNTRCGRFWTDQECLDEYGNEARLKFYRLMCERENLIGGPFIDKAYSSPQIELSSADENIKDRVEKQMTPGAARYNLEIEPLEPDYCFLLERLERRL